MSGAAAASAWEARARPRRHGPPPPGASSYAPSAAGRSSPFADSYAANAAARSFSAACHASYSGPSAVGVGAGVGMGVAVGVDVGVAVGAGVGVGVGSGVGGGVRVAVATEPRAAGARPGPGSPHRRGTRWWPRPTRSGRAQRASKGASRHRLPSGPHRHPAWGLGAEALPPVCPPRPAPPLGRDLGGGGPAGPGRPSSPLQVVLSALAVVAEDLVSLIDLLEPVLSAGRLVPVGMVVERLLTVSPPNLLPIGARAYTEDFVIVSLRRHGG